MLVALASAVLASVIAVAQGVPAGVKTIPLSEVKWVAQPNGLSRAALLGDPDKPGPYLQGEGAVLYFYRIGPSGTTPLQ
jgi:hypothetical protein